MVSLLPLAFALPLFIIALLLAVTGYPDLALTSFLLAALLVGVWYLLRKRLH